MGRTHLPLVDRWARTSRTESSGATGGLALLTNRRAFAIAGAASGALLATYTGVLVGNTAVPVWKSTRRALPLWFAAASAAGLASLVELIGPPRRACSLAAKTADVIGMRAVERAADRAGPGEAPHGSGKWRAAAAVLARFAIVDAGRTSAGDPRATFELQRRG
ncbi:MAG: hypothetical protein ACM31C_22845 [Acidobacteriota bacterium]